MRYKSILLVASAVWILTACKTHTVALSDNTDAQSKNMHKGELIEHLETHQVNFNTLLISKFNAELTQNNQRKHLKARYAYLKTALST